MADLGVLVPAAGKGRRLGADINKLYLPLRGRVLLSYTLVALESCPSVGSIVVAVGKGEEDQCRRLVAELEISKVSAVVLGGATRQQSVGLALEALDDRYELVAVHDGARPFFSTGLMDRVAEAARLWGAAVPAVAVKDTIKLVDNQGKVERTLSRERLVAVQTPQVFRRDLLREAYASAIREGFEATDDASLVEWFGHRVAVVPGEPENLKITTPEDLIFAEIYLDRDGSNHRPV